VFIDDQHFLAKASQGHADIGHGYAAPNALATGHKGNHLQLLATTEQTTQPGGLIDAKISHDVLRPQPSRHWPSSTPARRHRTCAASFPGDP
jgi:hypothetical protein